MISAPQIRLASLDDAAHIALLSRDLIEHGLHWGWTPARVARSVRDKETNVAIAQEGDTLVGFGIMKYRDEEAHLLLLAVPPKCQRRGVGTALIAWLESAALTAGIGIIRVEARVSNTTARSFYQRLGYREMRIMRGYYSGREDAVVLGKDLWA